MSTCKVITRQQEDRNPIDCCSRSGSNHIQCSRTDGGSTCIDLLAIVLLSKGSCSMYHALFIFPLYIDEITAAVLQRFTNACHIAVSKNTHDTFYKFSFYSVNRYI